MSFHRLKRVLAVTGYLMVASAFGAGVSSAPAAAEGLPTMSSANISDRLTADHHGIEVTYEPFGTQHIGVAELKKLNSGQSETRYFSVSPSQKVIYPKDAAYPVLDVQAWSRSRPIGNWAGRKLTEAENAQEKQEKEEKLQKEREQREKVEKERIEHEKAEKERIEAEEAEIPVSSEFYAGLNAGGWSNVESSELLPLHLGVVRIDTPSSIAAWTKMGLKVLADESGPYSSGGVSGLNHKAYVEKVVSLVRSNPGIYAVEILNEPGGNWFWGSNSESETNRQSYAQLLIEVHDALVSNFGSARPLIVASWDGGHSSSNSWGEAWSKNTTALADVDAVTNHPYGGTGSRSTAILGNRGLVEADEAKSHKPIIISEVGFPTKGPTGDSLQYTETEEAWAVYHFAEWAKSKGYITGVTFYGYRDEGEGGGYGIITHSGFKKKAYTALKEFNEALACTVCQ